MASSASSLAPVLPQLGVGSDAATAPIDPAARERALELARHDRAQREAESLETARLEAARQEAARQETERQEAARLAALAQQAAQRREAQRLEAEAARLEAERQAAARLELARQAAIRQEAIQQETARQEAARQELARQGTAGQEAAQQEAARPLAARQQAAQADEARREASRRAMGRQLDEEAARRDAAAAAATATATATVAGPSSRLPPSASTARRGRLFGRADANTELVLYAEAWARKIQLNMSVDLVRDAARRPHADPVVTVAIRSDGSVESVVFVVSSGVAEIDDAIRRIVQSLLPFPAFSPALAREFDVIEIRRTWFFDSAVRLY